MDYPVTFEQQLKKHFQNNTRVTIYVKDDAYMVAQIDGCVVVREEYDTFNYANFIAEVESALSARPTRTRKPTHVKD